MALSADFSATPRVGEGTLVTAFTDSSTGSIVSRKWILGDGTVVEGNETTVNHTYMTAAKYDVTLIVEDATSQDSETKQDYVIVNSIHAVPSFVIAQSLNVTDTEYWRFYIDSERYLVFETYTKLYRSIAPVITIKEWTLLEFHPGMDTMYMGTYDTVRSTVGIVQFSNTSPMALTNDELQVVVSSTMKIDELKLWSREVNLKDYYYETRGQAGHLDLTT